MKVLRALALLSALACTTAGAATYTVKTGDTLYSVARSTGVDAPTLMRLNNLNSSTIQVGQRLNLGGAAAPVAAPTAPQATAAAPQGGGAFVRSAATRYLGIRYVLGGMGAGGIDCSGFTLRVYQQLGINLPRTAAAQWRMGSAVNRSNLRAGDLVFFNTMGRTASHVGIYLGDGMMANANSYHGRTIVEPLFANAYWANRYDGARRVLQ